MRLGDLLATGGRIYPDLTAAAQGLQPIVITVPRLPYVPFRPYP